MSRITPDMLKDLLAMAHRFVLRNSASRPKKKATTRT